MKKKIIIATLSVLMLATLNGCSKNETSTANSSKADDSSSSVNKMVVDITEEKQTTTTTQPSETTNTAPESTAEPVKEGEGPTGNPTPQQIEDSMNNGSVIPTPAEIYINPEPSVNPSQNNSVFDAQMYEKFGVEVVLPGGNEANAQALYNAFKAKHPTLPWILNGNSVGLDWAPKSALRNYDLTDEEIDSSLAEWLAGRDYHTLTLEELYEHYHLCWGTTLGAEIGSYTTSIASHMFKSSGMVVGW